MTTSLRSASTSGASDSGPAPSSMLRLTLRPSLVSEVKLISCVVLPLRLCATADVSGTVIDLSHSHFSIATLSCDAVT